MGSGSCPSVRPTVTERTSRRERRGAVRARSLAVPTCARAHGTRSEAATRCLSHRRLRVTTHPTWTTTTPQLLERARAGDRPALEALLARHQRSVYRFGLKMCRDEEDAKDILQETLLAVARNVKDFRGASSVSTWLYTIARSFCIKKRRRSKFAPEQEESLDAREPGEAARQIADPARPPDDTLAGRQIEIALEQAIASLDPMYREVLVLRDVEGLTAPEVGEVMGLSVEAVKSRLHRARVAIRAAVAPLLGIPGAAEAARGAPSASPPGALPGHRRAVLEAPRGRDRREALRRHGDATSPAVRPATRAASRSRRRWRSARRPHSPRCPRPCRRRSGRR